MRKISTIFVVLLIASTSYGQDSNNFYRISNKIHFTPLDEADGGFLNDLWNHYRGNFDFVGKNVAFQNSGVLVDKNPYLEMHRKKMAGDSIPCDLGYLYIFDYLQKEKSGGYDAAILYWFKIPPRASIVVEVLREELLETTCFVRRKCYHFSDIPCALLDGLENMDTNDYSIINEIEASYLSYIFEVDINDFDHIGKRIYFPRGKKLFFNKEKSAYLHSKKRVPGQSVLYIFNDVQKEKSNGFDAAVIQYPLCKKKILPNKRVLNFINGPKKAGEDR